MKDALGAEEAARTSGSSVWRTKPVTIADSRASGKRTVLIERARSAPSAGHLQIGRSVSCGSVEPREAEARMWKAFGEFGRECRASGRDGSGVEADMSNQKTVEVGIAS